MSVAHMRMEKDNGNTFIVLTRHMSHTTCRVMRLRYFWDIVEI